MILVTGASGQFGKAVIDHLLKQMPASQIVALARDEAKVADLKAKGVAIRIGHYDDVASLDNAVKGVERVLLVSGMDKTRLQQHMNVIDAAKKAGVKHIVYTSVAMRDVNTSAVKNLMESHFQTENYLKASGVTYTFLRNSLYMDMVPVYVGEKVFDTGIFFPAGHGKTSFALRNEMAEAAANVMAGEGHENKIYAITAASAYSFDEIAQTLSQLSGKTVGYTSPDPMVFESQLKQFGVPEMIIGISLGFAADIKQQQFDTVSNDLEKLLGRKPASLTEGLKAIYKFK